MLGIELHSCCVRKIICGILSLVGTGYRIQRFQWQGICIIVFVLMPPTNPTSRLYLRVTWIQTLGHVGGGNTWRGYHVEGYYDTLTNEALVYPSQGGRYRAEGCMALGQ
jgi:hypothetical protein